MSRDNDASYYDAGGLEVLDIQIAKLTEEQFRGYLLGCALKYLCRLNFKGASRAEVAADARKAANYAQWLYETFPESKIEPSNEDFGDVSDEYMSREEHSSELRDNEAFVRKLREISIG